MKPTTTPIPERLQKYPKVDVGFFLDRVPEMLTDRSEIKAFMNFFVLYLDGVLTQSEFFDLSSDMVVDPHNSEQFMHLQTLVSQRDNSRRDFLEIG